MKIFVNTSESKPINIIVPNGLMLNPISVAIILPKINKEAREDGQRLKYSQALKLVREIKKTKKTFGKDWKLVEVKTADGTEVEIKI